VDIAVKSSRKAFQTWRHSKPTERRKLLNKLADLIERDAKKIAEIESLDNGKPYNFALNVDVALSVENLRYYAGLCDKIEGTTIPNDNNFFAYTRKEPLGVN
jgi:acyl-CoA reductase-like NAD-dependent aldehyde dehydrogenase